jgi:hypothetical protein
MTKRRLLVSLIFWLILIVAVVAGPALAVNDPFTPADQCDAPQGEAVGHPAFAHEQSAPASAPFSATNPGVSDGAEGNRSQASAQCPNAQP